MHCNTLGTFLHELLQDCTSHHECSYFVETHFFRTKWIKHFICKVVTMSEQFGHVRTVCRNNMGNNVVMMSGLFSDFRTKQRIAAKWTKMDTPGLKKEWSCERWVQADTRANMKTALIYITAGWVFPIFPPHFDKKGGNHFRLFRQDFDKKDIHTMRIICGFCGNISTKREIAPGADGWAEGAKSDKSDTPFMRVRARRGGINKQSSFDNCARTISINTDLIIRTGHNRTP